MIRWHDERFRFVTQAPQGTVGRFMGRLGLRIESTAKKIATEEKLVRSGRYRASISGRVVKEGGGLVLKVGSAVPYAKLLERGTDPHLILPRNARALWWDMPNDRGWMVQPDTGRPVRFVHHPGNRAYNVIQRAVLREIGGTAR